MLNKLNQILFTIISTSWTLVVYGIQQKWTLFNLNIFISSIILIVSPIFLTFIWLLTANKFLPNDNISGGCKDIEEADNDFLADYLGYFFIGIGIDEFKVLIMIYAIIFIFTYISQSKCYNPLLLIFKYKFYNVTTNNGTKIFLITKKELRNSKDVYFKKLKRINNMSYFDIGK